MTELVMDLSSIKQLRIFLMLALLNSHLNFKISVQLTLVSEKHWTNVELCQEVLSLTINIIELGLGKGLQVERFLHNSTQHLRVWLS